MLLSPITETDALSAEDVVAISKTWWVFLIMGTLSVIAGVILLEVDWTLTHVAYFVGAIFIVRGLFDLGTRPVDDSAPKLVNRYRHHQHRHGCDPVRPGLSRRCG